MRTRPLATKHKYNKVEDWENSGKNRFSIKQKALR